MALEYWELKQREAGNISAANMGRALRELCGDVEIPGVKPGFSEDLAKLHLPSGSYFPLKRSNIKTIGDLEEWLSIEPRQRPYVPGFGVKRIKQVEQVLNDYRSSNTRAESSNFFSK
jgi:hypothetical protein